MYGDLDVQVKEEKIRECFWVVAKSMGYSSIAIYPAFIIVSSKIKARCARISRRQKHHEDTTKKS